MSSKVKNNDGFTLVEMVVTLVILAILSAVAVPTVLGYIDKGRQKECEATRTVLATRFVSDQLVDASLHLDADYIAKQTDLTCPSGGDYSASGDMIKCSRADHTDVPYSGGDVLTWNADMTEDGENRKQQKETEPETEENTVEILLSVSPAFVTMHVGEQEQLTASYSVKINGEDKTSEYSISWSANDSAVAAVQGDGSVTGLKAGSCVVTATLQVGTEKRTAAATVQVIETSESADITLNHTHMRLAKGRSVDQDILTATLGPEDQGKRVEWSVDNSNVVAITEYDKGNEWGQNLNCGVNPIGVGTCTVTARVGNKEVSCTIEVYQALNWVNIGTDPISLKVGEEYQISPQYDPVDATYTGLTYYSDHPEVVQVDQNGLVRALKPYPREVLIRCVSEPQPRGEIVPDGILKISQVGVALNNIAAPNVEKLMLVGERQNMGVILYPEDTDYRQVIYTSSDENVLAVDQAGNITALAEGNAKVSCTSVDFPEKKVECSIEVKNPYPTKIHLECDGERIDTLECDLADGKAPKTLKIVIDEPKAAGYSYGNIGWGSSNTGILNVSSNAQNSLEATGSITDNAAAADSCFLEVTINRESIWEKRMEPLVLKVPVKIADTRGYITADAVKITVNGEAISDGITLGQNVMMGSLVDNPEKYNDDFKVSWSTDNSNVAGIGDWGEGLLHKNMYSGTATCNLIAAFAKKSTGETLFEIEIPVTVVN